MKIKITARHFKAKDSLQTYIKNKLEDLHKFNENILFADVILSFDKPPMEAKYCEIIVKLKEKIITAKEFSDDFSKAVDLAAEKIEIQLYKHIDKVKRKKTSKIKD